MIELTDINTSTMWGLGALTLATFFVTLLLLPLLVARIPADYFLRDRTRKAAVPRQHLVRIVMVRVIRNIAGLLFIFIGFIMLFTPGQGLLSILVGITLTDFPGKLALGRKIVQQPGVLKAINWIRDKAHVPPLEVPGDGE